MEHPRDKTPEELIDAGSELAGASIGGAIGFLAGGPLTAAGAAAFGVAVTRGAKRLLTDFAARQLSQRERARAGAAAAIALAEIGAKVEAGKPPRTDGFFESDGEDRSAAEELFEGVLQKSKNEHEERKVPYLGRFFANLAFTDSVSSSEANHLLSLAERLTYSQLCVLRLLLLKPRIRSLVLRGSDYRESSTGLAPIDVALLQGVYELNQLGLVACATSDGTGYSALLGWYDVAPSRLELTFLGERLARLLGLPEPPEADLDEVLGVLSKGS